jgi:hypothetical protein
MRQQATWLRGIVLLALAVSLTILSVSIWLSLCQACGQGRLLFVSLLLDLPLAWLALRKRGQRRSAGIALALFLPAQAFVLLRIEEAVQRSKMFVTYKAMLQMSNSRLVAARGSADGTELCQTGSVRVLLPTAPCHDAWGNPYRVWLTATESYVVSFGACGEPDVADPSEYPGHWGESARSDLVLRAGRLYQYPAGLASGN